MKKTISLLLVLVMMLALIPTSAFAEMTGPVISAESTYAQPGHTVDVNILIENNPGIVTTKLNVTFPEELTLVGYSQGSAFSDLRITAPAELSRGESVKGSANFTWLTSELEDDAKDGTILTLSFDVAENAELNKKYQIELTAGTTGVNDGTKVNVSTEPGHITTIDYTPGDVDESGEIDMIDVLMLCQYIVDDCKYNEKGYAVRLNDAAANVDQDDEIGMLDVLCICRYIVDDCKTNPAGYNIRLYPANLACEHTLEAAEAKAATCTEDGNIAYWHCSKCDEYFSDAEGTNRISYEDTILSRKEHAIVVIPAVDPNEDTGEDGRTEGRQCSVCGFWEVEPVPIPVEKTKYAISYSLYNVSDPKESNLTYLKGIDIENPNPISYSSKSKVDLILEDPVAPGYDFDGWYDSNGKRIYAIEAGTAKNLTLFARWTEHTYKITYNLYQTPADGGPTAEEYKEYKVSQGNYNLYNPKLYNYVFLGWFDNKGVEYKNVPTGTSGDLVLNAYYTSKRNLAVSKIDNNPIILEDRNANVVYFTYEIGEIRNIPLTDNLWDQTINSVAGLKQLYGNEYTVTEDKITSDTISNTITDMSVDSKTWTLSEDWNEVISNNETCSQSHEEGRENCKSEATTSSNTVSLTTQNSGSSYHKTEDGTTVYDYDSKTVTKDQGHTWNVDGNVSYANKMSANLGNATEYGTEASYDSKNAYTNQGKINAENWSVGGQQSGSEQSSATASDKQKYTAGISYENGIEASLGVAYGYHKNTNTVTKTGSDSVSVNSDISEDTSSWNNSATNSSTNSHSLSTTVRNTLSDIITTTKQYGKSYSHGGNNSETQGFSSTKSDTSGTSSTVTYSKLESKCTYSEISTDGKIEGKYRLIMVGTAHVFGVVGYDYNTKSYFTYTFSVMDDKTDSLVDYTPSGGDFTDQENSCIPFNVPIDIYNYVEDRTALTKGIGYITNSETGTATVNSYEGSCDDVVIPSYISDGKQAYKVTEISASAFAGTNVKNVILGEYIKSIPTGAFKNCTQLVGVLGSFTEIGDEAFAGCTNLTTMQIPSNVVKIGENAFMGVNSVEVRAINSLSAFSEAVKALPDGVNSTDEELAAKRAEVTQNFIQSVLNSGAQNIVLDLSVIAAATSLSLEVPAINSVEIYGGSKTFNNFTLDSNATTTKLKEITINNSKEIPLSIGSESLVLDKATVSADVPTLILRKDGAKITLINDSSISSTFEYAVIAKNPIVTAENIANIDGSMRITGNFGFVNSEQHVTTVSFTNGNWKEISDEEFNKYIQGFCNILLDANEGTLESGSENLQVFIGGKIENMPTPTRDYYTFDGWYTEAEGGYLVSNGDTWSTIGEATLYAHWTLNATSDWVKKSDDLPEDADIVATKYVYNLESSDGTMTGYTDKTERWSEYGSWSSWQNSAVSKSDSRDVNTRWIAPTYRTEYNYSRYNEYDYSSAGRRGWNGPTVGYWGGHYCQYYEARGWSTTKLSQTGSDSGYAIYDGNWYNETSRQVTVTAGYTQYQYRDRHKIYTYTFESDVMPTGDNISNVIEWVQYRLK